MERGTSDCETGTIASVVRLCTIVLFQIRICHAASKGYANVNIRFTPKTGDAVEIDIDADSIRMVQIARATNTGRQWQIDGAGENNAGTIIETPYWKNNQYPGEWPVDGRLTKLPSTGFDNKGRTAWMLDRPGTSGREHRLEAVTLVVATDSEGNDLPIAYIRWVYYKGDSHYMTVIEAGEGEPIVDGMRFFDIVRKQLPNYNPEF